VIADLGNLTLAREEGVPWMGLDATEAPLVTRDATTVDLYSLDWEAPQVEPGEPLLNAEQARPSMNAVSRALPIEFSPEALASICLRYGIRRLSAFGSVLRDDFSTGSDLDLLVEFQPGRTPGFAFFRLEGALSDLFGRRVDLNTKASLSPYFRERVLFEARDLYVAA
jgi:uncharacterized protein